MELYQLLSRHRGCIVVVAGKSKKTLSNPALVM